MDIILGKLLNDWNLVQEDLNDKKLSFKELSIIVGALENLSRTNFPDNEANILDQIFQKCLSHNKLTKKLYLQIKKSEFYSLSSDNTVFRYEHAYRNRINEVVDSFFKNFGKTFSAQEVATIKDSLFLSGGALPGLFSQNTRTKNPKNINDYDFYFKNEAAAFLLFQKLSSVFSNKTIKGSIKKNGIKVECKGFQKGVFNPEYDPAHNESDVTCFGSRFAPTPILPINGGISSNAISIDLLGGTKIQFIIFRTGDPLDVVDDFNFYHCMNYFDIKNQEMVYNNLGVFSFNSGLLKYNDNNERPLDALFRAFHYTSQGWNISKLEILKISLNMKKMDFNNQPVFLENMKGFYKDFFIENIDGEWNEDKILEIANLYDENDSITDNEF